MQPTRITTPGATLDWLLLIHQLPVDPAYLRVKVARRLRRLGAVQLKSSVYALPASDETLEDLRWLLREIVDGGGEATLSRARFVGGIDDEEVRGMFQREREAEYEEISTAAGDATTAEELARLRRRLDEATGRDFFAAPGRTAAADTVEGVAKRLRGGGSPPEPPASPPRGARWVTRRGIKVDRLASAWLIRRFIDPGARFSFVDPSKYRHRRGDLRFDMFEGEYGHEEERCTFETLLHRFGLDERALVRLGEVVHDLDCKESRYGHPEAAGLAALVAGLVATQPRDAARLEAALPLFDSLHASFKTLA